MLGIDLPQPLQRKDRSGAVAQQALQSGTILSFDAYAGIERETAAVFPGRHGLGVVRFEETPPGERSQKSAADLGLDVGKQLLIDGISLVKPHLLVVLGLKHPVNHDAVEVDVRIEGPAPAYAKSLHETARASGLRKASAQRSRSQASRQRREAIPIIGRYPKPFPGQKQRGSKQGASAI